MNKKIIYLLIIIECFYLFGCGIFLFKLNYKFDKRKDLLYKITIKNNHLRNNILEKTSSNSFNLYLKIEEKEKKGSWIKAYFLPANLTYPEEKHPYNTFTVFVTPQGEISNKQGAYKIFDISSIFIPLPNKYCKIGTMWTRKENIPGKSKYIQHFRFTIGNIIRKEKSKNIEININSNFDKKESKKSTFGQIESKLSNKISGTLLYNLQRGIPIEANYHVDTKLKINGIFSQESHIIKEIEIKLIN